MRYAFNDNINIEKKLSFDVVVVGAGLAGLYTALNIDPGLSVAVLSKEGIETSNSWLAQGGIAAAVSKDDQPVFHELDTVLAGAGMCDNEAVQILCDEGPHDIRQLQKMNVPFDLNEDGDLSITREGGHRRNRIVHAGGDATGRETVRTLAAIASEKENITFFEHICFVDAVLDEAGRVCGAVVNDSGYMLFETSSIVICTGGIGQVYNQSTNPEVATGDGIAAAIRAGAGLKDMEFVQFHPTGLYSATAEKRAFLISEAVRGEGGLLYNLNGERFMKGVHPQMELAPRDVVARAIYNEISRTGADHVMLDITMKDEEFLSARFPTIYNECLRRGINISRDMIPVCPVQHYLMGGIDTDSHGRTNVPGLFACGEAARTGVHGANRLASNSMLECLVYGRRAAEFISSDYDETKAVKAVELSGLPHIPEAPELDIEGLKETVRQAMSRHCFVIRKKEGLTKALETVNGVLEVISNSYCEQRGYLELTNMATVAREILRAALNREKSVGAHYMETRPEA